jgi:ferritin
LKENDYAAQVELQWFIKEQVEEEKSAGDINAQLARIGDNSVSLLMLDRALSERKGD